MRLAALSVSQVDDSRAQPDLPSLDPLQFAFSGLLKCSDCGHNFVMAGKHHYACSTRLYGGKDACENDAYLPREVIEPGLVAGIKRELAPPEVLDELQRRVRERQKGRGAPTDARAEIGKLERQVESLVEAIADGGLRSSSALGQRLQDAEAQLAALKARSTSATVEHLLPNLSERCRSAILNLERTIAHDPRRARMELNEHVGPIRVRTTPEEIVLEAEEGYMVESALLAAAGTALRRQIRVVAGVRFGFSFPAHDPPKRSTGRAP